MSGPVRALVVGSTNVDLVLGLTRLPQPGETVLASSATRMAGGKGGNQAVALARLGAQVTFVSAVGDDDDGRWSLAQLRDDGVDTAQVAVTDAPTGLAVVSLDSAGENSIVVVPGANGRVQAPADLSGTDVLLLSLEVPLVTVAKAARVAHEAGVPVVLNAAPAQPLPHDLLADVDVLLVNETEAELVGPTDKALVVTLGARGAEVRQGGTSTHVPAPHVEVVDTTGAGDCFAAALSWGIGSGLDLIEATRLACTAGALSVTRLGARGGLPTAADLDLRS